jgi:hypothetical protein
MKRLMSLGAAATTVTLLGACSSIDLPSVPKFDGQPSYTAAANETAAVESIELAFADGRGVGAFVSAIDPATDPSIAAKQRYRVRVVFDSGNHTTLLQDGTVALAIGQRVKLDAGRALPTQRPDIPHLSPTTLF